VAEAEGLGEVVAAGTCVGALVGARVGVSVGVAVGEGVGVGAGVGVGVGDELGCGSFWFSMKNREFETNVMLLFRSTCLRMNGPCPTNFVRLLTSGLT
jgi:hypothetical protein